MFNVSKVDVWKASLDDRPGGLAAKLEGLARAGADLEFIISRRSSSEPGKGVVFVTPLVGDSQIRAAAAVGFERSRSLAGLRIEGHDEAGVAFLITRALAAEGINLRGLSASRQGNRFVMYLAFDKPEDADRAIARLQRAV